MIRYLACPFCGWHRMADTSKTNASAWDERIALDAMVVHLGALHREAWLTLMERWTLRRDDALAQGDHFRYPADDAPAEPSPVLGDPRRAGEPLEAPAPEDQ